MVDDKKPHSCLTSFLGELGFEILGGWTAKNKSVGGQVAKPANLRGELQLKHNPILMGWFGSFGLVSSEWGSLQTIHQSLAFLSGTWAQC